jgi:hypothetical protein
MALPNGQEMRTYNPVKLGRRKISNIKRARVILFYFSRVSVVYYIKTRKPQEGKAALVGAKPEFFISPGNHSCVW